MNEISADDGGGDVRSDMIDLSGLDLAGVADLYGSPALNKVLQSLRDEAQHPDDAVAGFNSSI